MKQQVKMFSENNQYSLEYQINELAKTHHIENISYSVYQVGYSTWHYACVLYT